jgi:hypothetical protein
MFDVVAAIAVRILRGQNHGAFSARRLIGRIDQLSL